MSGKKSEQIATISRVSETLDALVILLIEGAEQGNLLTEYLAKMRERHDKLFRLSENLESLMENLDAEAKAGD